ncbi:helix-turn-helix domain-containing protein [Pseudoduganella aquatica]|uniref:helix-turn-helix domain-containing protein n=1 Tax=Pseudoduganella aquatica TaxID=2660641 RepID=UPI001E350868|nr:helix-turn-helix transcriptional regulator [Pseudoduganella aquatica]
MTTTGPCGGGAAHLFDTLIKEQHLKNDAALCRAAGIGPPLMSKMRNGRQRVSAEVMLRLHEAFGMPFATQRLLLACDSSYPHRPHLRRAGAQQQAEAAQAAG